ncbi:MAG: hypothetical protein IJ896_13615 [Fibrobacter sp.]|nr:hypothetical protein [Fibrobacter sp.]
MAKKSDEYSNAFRFIWIAVDVVMAFVAVAWAHNNASFASTMDYFTYWGFVVSVLAGLATFFEILNASVNSKKLSEEINERTISIEKSANELKNSNKLISASECTVLLDQIIDLVDSERFDEAVVYIREIRKNLLKTELKRIFDEKIKVYVDVKTKQSICYDYYEMERMIEAYRTSKKGKGAVAKYQIVRAKIFYASFRTNLSRLI